MLQRDPLPFAHLSLQPLSGSLHHAALPSRHAATISGSAASTAPRVHRSPPVWASTLYCSTLQSLYSRTSITPTRGANSPPPPHLLFPLPPSVFLSHLSLSLGWLFFLLPPSLSAQSFYSLTTICSSLGPDPFFFLGILILLPCHPSISLKAFLSKIIFSLKRADLSCFLALPEETELT